MSVAGWVSVGTGAAGGAGPGAVALRAPGGPCGPARRPRTECRVPRHPSDGEPGPRVAGSGRI
ncbi:hypothetical protein KPATCC21470_5495 [Kitasatospora purpeofusca]